MTYSRDIPQAQPSPAATQPQIQTNFAQYASVFQNNHTALNNNNQGDHEGIVMQNQSSDPGVTQDLVALYAKNAASQAGTQPQLFAQIKKFLPTILDTTNAGNLGMQLTYNQVNTSGPQFQSFLPGGFLMFCGFTNNIAVPITLSPSTSSLFLAIAIPTNLNGGQPNNVSTTITQPNVFRIDSNSAVGGNVFYWLAIGTA
jgi:hypothetical protein